MQPILLKGVLIIFRWIQRWNSPISKIFIKQQRSFIKIQGINSHTIAKRLYKGMSDLPPHDQ